MIPFTAYNITYLLSQTLGVYAVYKLMRAFFEERRVKSAAEIISYISYYILTSLVYLIFNIPIINFAVSILSYFLLTFLYRSSLKKKIFVSTLTYVFGFCTEMMVVILTGYIGFPINEKINYDSIFGVIALNVLLFAIAMAVSGFKSIKKENTLPRSYWFIILMIPISSLLILLQLFKYSTLLVYEIVFSVAAILIINFMVFFFLFDKVALLYRDKQESMLIKQQNEYYVNQLAVIEDLHETSKEMKHNIKNHLIAILSYIENNKNDEAKKYISDIIDFYQNKNEIVHTGYPQIDSLLNYKLSPAVENDTEINVTASLPSDLIFSSFDLTVILGNLIDNALEAVSCVRENRFIDLKLSYSKGMMIVKISNPYENDIKTENGIPVTSKNDKENHGLGLKSVNEVLKRYDGMTEIETEKNIFTITAVLYLKQGQEIQDR
ncbi:MAG: GHKL domain-containing protein [Ruminococcaceae bacterium]|nr:GHKL domain-containing protein [Oscillospiraceae bacterium]